MQALIIPFSDADADIKRIIKRLLRLKKDFQVKELDTLPMDTDLSEKFKDPFFVELGETIDHIRAIQRGEIEDDCQDAFEFLAELESELELVSIYDKNERSDIDDATLKAFLKSK